MKRRSYFISLLVLPFLFSCTKDDELDKLTPEEPAMGMLSLVVDADLQTRAEAETLPHDRITRLTVLVFRADQAGAQVALKDTALSAGASGSITEVEPFAVGAGSVQILAIANAPSGATFAGKSLTEVRTLTAGLTDEVHGKLSMNSKVLAGTIAPNRLNRVGQSVTNNQTEHSLSSAPMKLYRNVARIELSRITLGASGYGTPVSFKLDSVFVANVKSQAMLVPSTDRADESGEKPDWGFTEVVYDKTSASFWWHGAYKAGNDHYTGPLRLHHGEEKAFLAYNFNAETDWIRFPYHDEAQTELDKNIMLEYGRAPSYTNDAERVNFPVGNFFYAYENMQGGAGAQTLLVVSGAYTYIPTGQTQAVTLPNRYYAVVVNKETTSISGVAQHTFVKRNTKYRVAMTVTGPGSDKPYDPSVTAHVSGAVTVLDWNTIEIRATVD